MTKIPLWIKNKKGKYELFPYHLLETFPDGKRGFRYSRLQWSQNPYDKLWTEFNHVFYDEDLSNLKSRIILRVDK